MNFLCNMFLVNFVDVSIVFTRNFGISRYMGQLNLFIGYNQ